MSSYLQTRFNQHLFTYKALFKQAWPVFVGQIAVMANGVVDSLMAGHAGSDVLAAVAVGNSVYISLYVGLMGVILAITPISAEHFGAKHYAKVGQTLGQGLWLAALLSACGIIVMLYPDPLLALAHASPTLDHDIRGYLHGIAVGLPAALVFRVFYTTHQAISMPKVVMRLQVLMLAIKVPLNAWLMFGGIGIPALGAAGCGWATAISVWVATLITWGLWVVDSRYTRYKTAGWLAAPQWAVMGNIAKLGIPIAGAYIIEVTSFTLVAILVARFGVDQVSGHQIVANLSATCYMMPLSLANATSVMASQRLGAGEPLQARRFIAAGLLVTVLLGITMANVLYWGQDLLIGFYTQNEATFAVAKELIPLVAMYHLFDGLQAVCAFALRAYRVATLPMVIFAVCLWGIGLTGGVWLGLMQTPAGMARGFWIAAIASLALAAVLLFALLVRTVWQHQSLMNVSR